MAYLQEQQLIAETSKQILVRNRLVFAGTTEGVSSLADLPGLQRVALCSPKSSPAGRYAELAMTEAGIYQQLQENRQLVLAKDVRQALLYADRGEVDGAFVYQTDAMLAKQAQVLFAVPQELYPKVVYPAALTESGAKKKTAETFFAYLFSPSAQDVLRRHGFGIEK